eukprot:m.10424 g.10424  ORF g.10424 m.10424 type:complete len:418 (-) comp2745_c0_seq1:1487-2740(-)
MMMTTVSNSPTPNNMLPREMQKEDLASFSKMLTLTPGVERPLSSEATRADAASFRNQSNFCSDPTAGVTGGSPEYWRRLEKVLGQETWAGPTSRGGKGDREHMAPVVPAARHAEAPDQFRPQVPAQPTLGSPVPIVGNVPVQQMGPLSGSPPSCDQQSQSPSSNEPATTNQYEKPPYSFPCLIGLSLQSAPSGRQSVAQIYDYICTHFPYFRTAKAGWKNSVRHNLSLNKFFCKLERRENEQGKGSMWGIVPENKEQLIRDIQACRNRYPSKFRGYATQHEGGTTYMHTAARPMMPAAPAPKTVNRAASSPMIFGNHPMHRQPQQMEESRRISLPAVQEFDLLDFDCLPMMKAEPGVDNFLLGSEVCWIGDSGSSHSSSSPTDDMEMTEEWLPIPEDLSAYIASGGEQSWGSDSMFN